VATLPIETERPRLRHLAEDDWHAVHAYTGDTRVMTFLPEGVIMEEQTRRFIAGSMTEDARTFTVLPPSGGTIDSARGVSSSASITMSSGGTSTPTPSCRKSGSQPSLRLGAGG
jgi:hypothetical protein